MLLQRQTARFSSGTSGRATKQACPATSLVLRWLVLNWDQLAVCVLVFYKRDKANCRKCTPKCKTHIMKSVQNMRQREKRQRREISLLQNAKRIIMESVQNTRQRKKETKKGNKFTTNCKVHNYGIGAEYKTEERRQRRKTSLLQNTKPTWNRCRISGRGKGDEEGKQQQKNYKFTNTFPQHEDWGIVQSSGRTPFQRL